MGFTKHIHNYDRSGISDAMFIMLKIMHTDAYFVLFMIMNDTVHTSPMDRTIPPKAYTLIIIIISEC